MNTEKRIARIRQHGKVLAFWDVPPNEDEIKDATVQESDGRAEDLRHRGKMGSGYYDLELCVAISGFVLDVETLIV